MRRRNLVLDFTTPKLPPDTCIGSEEASIYVKPLFFDQGTPPNVVQKLRESGGLLRPIPEVGEVFRAGFGTCTMTPALREIFLKNREKTLEFSRRVERSGLDQDLLDELQMSLPPGLRQDGWTPSKRTRARWKKQRESRTD